MFVAWRTLFGDNSFSDGTLYRYKCGGNPDTVTLWLGLGLDYGMGYSSGYVGR